MLWALAAGSAHWDEALVHVSVHWPLGMRNLVQLH